MTQRSGADRFLFIPSEHWLFLRKARFAASFSSKAVHFVPTYVSPLSLEEYKDGWKENVLAVSTADPR